MKPLPVIACLLIATAGALVFLGGQNDGNPNSPPASTRVMNRERPARSASSTAKFIESARHLSQAERKDRIRALSDSDLQRLTRAIIAEFLSAADLTSQRSSVSLLTLLAMESGRRDIDGFQAEIDELCDQETSIICELKINLYCAAVAGLATENPQRAADIRVIESDPYLPSIEAANEIIVRAWARMDPDAAWQAVSSEIENGEFYSIHGLLAEIKDPVLRATILDRVSKLVANRQIVNGTITRNSIDAILNTPNRNALKVATALGLAEQDPDAAWEWINGRPLKDDKVPLFEDSPIIPVFSGSPPSNQFLREWAVRQPEQAMAFRNQHADDLSNPEQMQLAFGLLYRDPVSAMNALPAFTEPDERLEWFSRWIKTFPFHSNENSWPVLPYLNDTLPRSQIFATVSQNLSHLHLPSDLEAQALQAVSEAQEAHDHSQILPTP